MSYCPQCAAFLDEIEQLKTKSSQQEERIRLDEIRIKGIVKRADEYAIELHDLKNTYR